MALQDVNWGGVILGAAAVTGAVAAFASTAPTAVVLGAAALAGGVLGHWTTKITAEVAARLSDSVTAIAHKGYSV